MLSLKLVTKESFDFARDHVSTLTNVLAYICDALNPEENKWGKLIEKIVEGSVALSWFAHPAVGMATTALAAVVSKAADTMKEKDPEALAAIACSAAYQAAMGEAMLQHWGEKPWRMRLQLKQQLQNLPEPEAVDFTTFDLDVALTHPFTQRADEMLRTLLHGAGIPAEDETKLFNTLHERFKDELGKLLAHGDTKAKFEPFEKMMNDFRLAPEKRTRLALQKHAAGLVAQYQRGRLFGNQPFALKHVYLNTECGSLKWGDVDPKYQKGGGRLNAYERSHESEADERRWQKNPFSENHGGRHDLLDTVMSLITAPAEQHEPIVIQGLAGQGKSSFTLRLSERLEETGFIPVRVRLKKLELRGDVLEALALALQADADEADYLSGYTLTREVFNYPHGTHKKLSRYVLMLDGWDELQLTDNRTFQAEVHEMMTRIRSEFFGNHYPCKVRVIVTGRPNPAVNQSSLLKEATPLLTLRALKRIQITDFAYNLWRVTQDPPFLLSDDSTPPERWLAPPPKVFAHFINNYRKKNEPLFRATNNKGKAKPDEEDLDVLGLPLLVFLTVRVFAEVSACYSTQAKQQMALNQLARSPVWLYRALTDLTCVLAGKAPKGDANADELSNQWRVRGETLRNALRQTAIAMTVLGQEYLSKDEWNLRMEPALLAELNRPRQASGATIIDEGFVKLMISFYFKGGHSQQGMEFAHKSFREYLFAEAIVETLKEYSRRLPAEWVKRETGRDFTMGDGAYEFSRALCPMLASQWLTEEVRNYLRELLAWEIECSEGDANSTKLAELKPIEDYVRRLGLPNDALRKGEWLRSRDGLAQLWAWWADGAHLRLRVEYNRQRGGNLLESPYVQELAAESRPKAQLLKVHTCFEPFSAYDARLGDSLFQLTAWVHSLLIETQGGFPGWPELNKTDRLRWPSNEAWEARLDEFPFRMPVTTKPSGTGFQSVVRQGNRSWITFAPSGEISSDDESVACWNYAQPTRLAFRQFIARINSVAGRPFGVFPHSVEIVRSDFRSADLDGVCLGSACLDGARLDGASLAGADLYKTNLNNVSLDGSDLNRVNFVNASLNGASLDGANLFGAYFSGASLICASLIGTDLSGVLFLKIEQLREADWIDENTKFPTGEEFSALKQEMLYRQAEGEDEVEETR